MNGKAALERGASPETNEFNPLRNIWRCVDFTRHDGKFRSK
jgi:hypothetical protein